MAGPFTNGVGMMSDGALMSSSRDNILLHLRDALNIVHSSQSTNQSRHDAQRFLEGVKALPEAPSHGFTLAFDKARSPIERHYGLSLLEHALKHRWAEFNDNQADYLRSWVLQLSQNVSRDDPVFLRNKIAQLWVEVAKRMWAAEWMDMDKLLVQLWEVSGSLVHKELVLQILEILSEEVFNGDDAVVALREGALSKAAVEIFLPAALLSAKFPNRQVGPEVRYGDEGWLDRVTHLLGECLEGDVQNNEDVRACAVRALAVLYSLAGWVLPDAISASFCVGIMCRALAASHVAIQRVLSPCPKF
jgi:exportin-5